MKKIFVFVLLTMFQLGSVYGGSEVSASKLLYDAKKIKKHEERIKFFSSALLGNSYQLGPLGEGEKSRFDRDPLFRFDLFDCTTFVETVLALASSSASDDFVKTIKKIRYKRNIISFSERNHFPILDWMNNGYQKGLFTNISRRVAGSALKSIKMVSDKKKWILNMSDKDINCSGKGCGDLTELFKLAKKFKPEVVDVHWVPYSFIFQQTKNGYYFNDLFLKNIPKVSFFNSILVPQKNIPAIATKMAVRHQGVLIKRDGRLYVRHAYIGSKKVEEIPALDFFLKAYLNKKDRKNLLGIGLSLFHLR